MGSAAAPHYRPDIDGLRALAVLAVLAFHAAPGLLPGGFLGVDVFFVISGFLISSLILAQRSAGSFSIATFYLRRARRILPALLLMLVVVSLLSLLILMPDELEAFARLLVAGVTFVPNLALLRETGYFDAAAHSQPLLHLWSLGVEEQFYFVWPALLILLARRDRPASALMWIAALAGASFLANVLVFRESPQAAFYLPFTRFWELMIGAMLATVPAESMPFARSRRLCSVLSVLGILLIVGPMPLKSVSELGAFVAVASTLGAALFIAAGPLAVLNRSVFSFRPVVYVGLISYPLYLWHWPLLSFLRIAQVENRQTDFLLRLLMLAIALAAAVVSYHWIERPLRSRNDLGRLGAWLGALMLALGAWGFVILIANGFPGRTPLATAPLAWSDELRKTRQCMDLYGFEPGLREDALCVRNDYDRAPQIVLIGDSHANAWWPGILAAYPGYSALDIGAAACPFLRNTDFWLEGTPRRRGTCPQLMEIAYGAITADTRLVILAARGAVYVAANGDYEGYFDFPRDGHLSSPDYPAAGKVEIFERELARDVSRLLGSGHEVALVLQVPELDFLPGGCLRARPYERLLPKNVKTCAMPRAVVERRQANYRAAVVRVSRAVADPRLHILDPMDALCDAAECHVMIGGVLMYRDDDHLSQAGSRYVWEKIRPRGLPAVAPPAER